MAIDLTRFDFHAKRFYFSEAVRAMTAEEIGQYMLLLIEAWMGGKDTTLPNDPTYLAQLARAKEVSPRVINQFRLVETKWGKRLQNETLLEEWMVANQRSDNGRKAVEVRWNNERNTPVSDSYYPNQAKPIKPDQINQSNDTCNFKNLAVRYRKTFGVNLSHGNATKDSYATACREYSEDVVLACFDEWAPENMWIKDRRHTNGLRQFYDALPAMVESESAIKQEKEDEAQKEQERESAQVRSVEAGHREFLENEKTLLQELEEQDAAAKRISENPSALFGSTE